MEEPQLMVERTQSLNTGFRARKFLHRQFRLRVAPAPRDSPRPSAIFQMMCWFGLSAGLLELLLVVAQRELIARISLESLRTNRHFLWMIPAADLAIFAVCGVVLARLARLRPGSVLSLCHRTGPGLLALGALLSVECLHPIVAMVLSSA